MLNGVIDGNVMAALIMLIAGGIVAIWRDVNSVKRNTDRLALQMDLLWSISPYAQTDQNRAAKRPRRR